MQSSFLHKLSVFVRADDWIQSFVPFVMGCVYLWAWWFRLPFTLPVFFLILLSLITTVGFASMGYFINEFFDKKQDAAAGKINRMSLVSPAVQAAIFFTSLLLIFLPWIWLPSAPATWGLIALQLLLFLVYSMPFPRLKEALYASVIIDSLYAYVVPLILSCYTFGRIAQQEQAFPPWTGLFAAAAFFIGLRNILIHQMNDALKDSRGKVRTLPLVWGVQKARTALRLIFFYEIFFVLLWLALLGQSSPVIFCFLPFYLYACLLSFGEIANGNHDWQRNLSIDKSYQYAFPFAILLVASIAHPKWALLLPVHLLLFVPYYFFLERIFVFIKRLFYATRHWLTVIWYAILHVLKVSLNYFIYYFFRCFGVDLRLEKKSAFRYLSEKFGAK